MGAMEFRSIGQIRERYADMYTTALLANWKVWPVAQVSTVNLTATTYSCARPSANKFPVHTITI